MTPPSDHADAGPLGPLPRLSARAVHLRETLRSSGLGDRLRDALGWLSGPLGPALEVGPVEVIDRPSGLTRAGAVALVAWPGRATRLALGLDTTLAHALVDRLLGYERFDGEERLAVTPVEWGLLTLAAARTLAAFDNTPELVLERVGSDPFLPDGLGPVVTLRWAVRVGSITGSARLWLPESVLLALADLRPPTAPIARSGRLGALAATWRAEAGTVTFPRGLGRLRAGSVHPIDGSPLRGSPSSPEGPVALCIRDGSGRTWFPAEPAPMSGGGRLVLTGPACREPLPREALAMSTATSPPDPSPSPAPADVPVTLVVELGRVNLPLTRVADLKPGDVVELARHAREPVELTSGGKLVARGELVLLDTELAVRVTNVFL